MTKRVAVVAATFPPSLGGGVAAAHAQLAGLLAKHGAEVRKFAFLDAAPSSIDTVRYDSSESWKRWTRRLTRILFRILDPSGRAYQTADILESLPGARRLQKEIQDFAPDEVVLPDHGCPGLAIGRIAEDARVTLVSHHNPMRFVDQPGLNAHSRLDARLAVALENRALRHVDRVVVPCRYMADVFRDTYRFSGPIGIIPNVIDIDALDSLPSTDPRPLMGLGPEVPLVYIPSAGSVFKGASLLADLLESLQMAALRPFGVYLSGHVPQALLDALPAYLAVYAPGRLPVEENLAIVKSCNLALSPTLIENFSMALLEAQLLGLQAASFDIGGNAELVDNGTTGRLVAPSNCPELARQTAILLANWTPEMAQSVRQISRDKFDPGRWIGYWLN